MNTKFDEKPVTNRQLKTELKKVDIRFNQLEWVLRDEIKITAKETKEELREEFKKGNNRLYNIMDDFIKEIRDSLEERTLVSHQLMQLSDNVGKLTVDMQKIKDHVFTNN